MLPAPLPPDESARLALLRSLALLDSAPENAFDRLTRLTCQLMGTPVALVCFVDADRQWFKSRVGLEVQETPRELSFCAHVIHGADAFVVSDATLDQRFHDNPLVTGEPHVRAYAGVPLRSAEGLALGTLCAIDHVPREFSATQLQSLTDLGQLVEREILQRQASLQAQAVADEASQARRDSEALFHTTYEHAPVGIAMVGLDGRWLRFNRKLCEVLARPAQELSTLTFQDLTHPDDLELDLNQLRQVLSGEGDGYAMDKRYLRPDGGIVWAHLTVRLVREGGQPSYFISVVEDITARRQAEASLHAFRETLEDHVSQRTNALQQTNDLLSEAIQQRLQSETALRESENELRSVLHNALDAYVSIDEAGTIVDWNQQAEVTFGWPRQEAIGRQLDELILPPEFREAHRRGLERAVRTGVGTLLGQRLELPVLTRSGVVIPCEVTLNALPSPRGRLFSAFLHDITKRKEAEKQLAQRERRLRDITDNLPALIAYFDAEERCQFANAQALKISGLTSERVQNTPLRAVLGPRYEEHRPYIAAALSGERVCFNSAWPIQQRMMDFQSHFVPDLGADGKAQGFYIMSYDQSALKSAERRSVAGEQRLQAIADNLPALIAYIDAEERYQFCNRTYLDWLGVEPQDMVGHTVHDPIGKTNYALRETHLKQALGGQRTEFTGEVSTVHGKRHLHTLYVPQFGPGGEVQGVYALANDVTSMKLAEQRLVDLARSDPLTNLPNRRGLEVRMEDALARSRRSRRPLAVMYLDIDRFKAINDRLGHAVGDEVLQMFARRLTACVRETDMVSRLAGDEFVLVIENLKTDAEAQLVASKVLGAISLPFELEQVVLDVGTSIGIAYVEDAKMTGDAVLSLADKALYQAKDAGRNTYRLNSSAG